MSVSRLGLLANEFGDGSVQRNLGDTVQLLRYVPLVAAAGGSIQSPHPQGREHPRLPFSNWTELDICNISRPKACRVGRSISPENVQALATARW
jgi:hypothetical protein